MKVRIGDVLVRRGALEPFIVSDIEYLSEDRGVFDITHRHTVNRNGELTSCGRRVRSRNLSVYELISHEFGDKTYVEWANRERGGQFIRKASLPKAKPSVTQLDTVKAVFYRQNRMLNPGITVEEVERLWEENYFPLYSQICFELRVIADKTDAFPPLNYDPPNPTVLAPKNYLSTVCKPRPFYVAPKPPEAKPPWGTFPVEDHQVLIDLAYKAKESNEVVESRILAFKKMIVDINHGNGDYLVSDNLKQVLESSNPEAHILAVMAHEDGILLATGNLSLFLIHHLTFMEIDPLIDLT